MLRVDGLYKSIGKTEILRGVSVSACAGEIVGLLGPNGAGKSSLMKVLTGLWNYDGGEVEVCGIRGVKESGFSGIGKRLSWRLPREVSRKIGYLPENNPLYADMYVREYLGFMKGISGGETDIDELIDRVGLRLMVSKKISELSKGYRQRVGLAQAIMCEPELLILDEPTTGLDPNQLDEIRGLIRELGRDRTVIFSTHILQEVKAVCTRAVIISEGQIKEDTSDFSNLEALFRERTR